jgi:hypothetical protein
MARKLNFKGIKKINLRVYVMRKEIACIGWDERSEPQQKQEK